MIKISANVSKKVPIRGLDYSSQAFGAAMEIEVSDTDRPEAVQQRLQELYSLLSETIDQQIAGAAPQTPQIAPRAYVAPARQLNPPQTAFPPAIRSTPQTGARAPRSVNATEAQQRALYAICQSLNLDLSAVLAQHNVSDASMLSVKAASQLIDQLKSRQNGNGTHAR